jgi:probable rRNA maturation factor
MKVELSYQLEDPPQGLPSEEDLCSFIEQVLEAKVFASLPIDSLLSISFIDKALMQNLNRQYRNKDYATDVLSFISNEQTPQGFLWGEILISPAMAMLNAIEYQHSLLQEIKALLVHGILHLHGYDHESDGEAQSMQAMEALLLDSLYRGDQ